MMLPEAFTARVLRDLGAEEGAALCAALESEAPTSVRLNPAKIPGGPAGEFPCGELPNLQPERRVSWCREGWYLTERPSFTFDPDFHAGAYYVQEASSQFVEHLLEGALPPGARLLDLCAAPGGKTTLYASLVGPEGLVVANEIDRRRASVLADNVRKWGTGNVAVTCCEAGALGDFEAWFDVVAVDAPCSGEGMFRKDTAARGEWSEANVRLCAARQDGILREAWRALKPGGTLVYSTCTFNRDEDEGSLERLLAWAEAEVEETAPVDVEASWGVVCGRVGAFRTFRFYPHRACGEGFFAAVARKSAEAGGTDAHAETAPGAALPPVDRKTAAELSRWLPRTRSGCALRRWRATYLLRLVCRTQAEAVRTLSEVLPVIGSGVALGPALQGGAETRSGAGLLPGAEPCCRADGRAGRSGGAALPAASGDRRRGAGRRDEPRRGAGPGAGFCQTDRGAG